MTLTTQHAEEVSLFAARADVVAGRLDQDLEDRLWDLVHSNRPAIRDAAIRLAHQAQEKHQAAMVNEWQVPRLLEPGVYTDGVC